MDGVKEIPEEGRGTFLESYKWDAAENGRLKEGGVNGWRGKG